MKKEHGEICDLSPVMTESYKRYQGEKLNAVLSVTVILSLIFLTGCGSLLSGKINGNRKAAISSISSDNDKTDNTAGTPSEQTPAHEDILNFLSDMGADIEAESGTPLHYAAWRGDVRMVRHLISNGADINATSKDGLYPLHMAVRCLAANQKREDCCRDVISILRDNGAKTDIRIAASLGIRDVVTEIIKNGEDVQKSDCYQKTPLHYAAEYGQAEIADILLRHSADLDVLDRDGCTPLHLAAGNGHKDTAELLLANGANINAKSGTEEATPIYYAAREGKENIVKMLILKGAGINVRDKYGWTPLHRATVAASWKRAPKSVYLRIAEHLILNGADINARNIAGITPLRWALKYGQNDMAELLKKYDAQE